jgi:chemotaxis family two-component system response regulator Rcp1
MTVNTTQKKGRPAEILLVEDSRGDVILAQKAFGKANIPNHITVAGNGTQALEILHHEGDYINTPTPDIILLDLNLPKKSGHEVLAEIKADENLKRIPVIILSSSRAEADVLKSYEMHANSYIMKPRTLDKYAELVSTVEEFWFSMVILPNVIETKHPS